MNKREIKETAFASLLALGLVAVAWFGVDRYISDNSNEVPAVSGPSDGTPQHPLIVYQDGTVKYADYGYVRAVPNPEDPRKIDVHMDSIFTRHFNPALQYDVLEAIKKACPGPEVVTHRDAEPRPQNWTPTVELYPNADPNCIADAVVPQATTPPTQ